GNVDGFHADGIDVVDAVRFQIFDGEALRRPTTGVQSIEFSRLRVVVNCEQVSAHAVHIRLHYTHDGVCSNCRVHGVAAPFQNVRTGLGSQKLRGGHNSQL